jgi:hypothetical protein
MMWLLPKYLNGNLSTVAKLTIRQLSKRALMNRSISCQGFLGLIIAQTEIMNIRFNFEKQRYRMVLRKTNEFKPFLSLPVRIICIILPLLIMIYFFST